MTDGADRALVEAMAALERALTHVARPHMLIGGLAVIARGVPRDTHDVDATVWAADLDLGALLEALDAQQIRGRIADVEEFAREAQVLLLVHEPTGTPMEVTLAWLPFESEAIERAQVLDLGGVVLPVAVAEDLVIYKAVASRDRDRSDVERLLRLHAGDIDVDRVRDLVAQFAEALEEPERLEELDRILARVRDD